MKLQIEKLDYHGHGVAHENGKICFASSSLPNEIVQAKLIEEHKNYNVYETNKVLLSNQDRIDSYCPYSKECGGCIFDIVSYFNSVKYKKVIMQDILKYHDFNYDFDITYNEKPLGYRNKISLKIKNGVYGYYKEKTHEFVAVNNCLLASKAIQEVFPYLSYFNIKNGNITLRSNYNDEILFVIETLEEPIIDQRIADVCKIAGIIWNHKTIYNHNYFFERRKNFLYKIKYDSFFQINPNVSTKILEDVLTNVKSNDIVFDLYCGVGFFSIPIASIAKYVVGIEENTNAVINALENAKLNHIENVSYHAGKVENIITKLPAKANKVVVDPPRQGLDKKVISSLLNNHFEMIIYVSCNPLTLVRDLKLLQDKYKIISIHGYDMFSYTSHCESVVLLTKK